MKNCITIPVHALRHGPVSPVLLGAGGEVRPQAGRRRVDAPVLDVTSPVRAMGGFDADAVSQAFFPDGRHRALLVVNIGQPNEQSFRPRQGDHRRIVGAIGHRRRQEVETVFRRRRLQGRANGLVGRHAPATTNNRWSCVSA